MAGEVRAKQFCLALLRYEYPPIAEERWLAHPVIQGGNFTEIYGGILIGYLKAV